MEIAVQILLSVRITFFALLVALAGAVSALAQTAALTPAATSLNPAGGTIAFGFNGTFNGSALFKLDVTIPAGWAYVSGVGEPGLRPGPGAENTLSWLDLSPLSSPVRFSFTLSYPAGVLAATIASSVTLRQDGGRADLVPALVSFGGRPAITASPLGQSVAPGETASFSVVAGGAAPFTYQWRKNDAPISGATSATLTIVGVQAADTGSYSVTVTNALGATTSSAVILTLRGRGYAGTWFGSFASGGSFALLVRDDNTGVFLGYASGPRVAIASRDVVVDEKGHFRIVTVGSAVGPATVAAAAIEIVIDASITTAGALTGSAAGLDPKLTATRSPEQGTTRALAGFYQAGPANLSSTSYAIISSVGQIWMVFAAATNADAGSGAVDAAGRITVATAGNASVTGMVAADTATLTAIVTNATGARVEYIGGKDGRAKVEKLINLATRGSVGGTAGAMFAGFFLRGDSPRPVMVRAIGPSLAAFGVDRALAAPRLELFRGSETVAIGTAWGGSSNAAAIAAAAVRSGAFALDPASRDAVLLLTLDPGSYTAVVSGENGASGVALVEVYDVSENATAGQRIVNLASRGAAGGGNDTLTAGLYISGVVPKRVLIRGIGPALGAFGVPGTLADPSVRLFNQAGALVATNDNWGDTADAPVIAATAAAVGAFALPPGGKDAALLLNLAPGSYTVQVGAAAGAIGAALVEIYEVP